MSTHILGFFSRSLPLTAALLLVHAGGAVAADSAGDIQRQTRDMLAGAIPTHSAPPAAGAADSTRRPGSDEVELQLRRLLLGVTDSPLHGITAARPEDAARRESARKVGFDRDDEHTLAQRVLLGLRSAASIGG
jgi:hypothetical protein